MRLVFPGYRMLLSSGIYLYLALFYTPRNSFQRSCTCIISSY